MADIALAGGFIIPLGLAASTFSSAIGSIIVAPRTLQALAGDASFPSKRMNRFLYRGRGETNEPYNATLLTVVIAMILVGMIIGSAIATTILGSVGAEGRIWDFAFRLSYLGFVAAMVIAILIVLRLLWHWIRGVPPVRD